MASPSAFRTAGLAVFSPNGVVTGWAGSNGWENGDVGEAVAWFQNSPNRTAPRCPASHRMFQWASGGDAAPRGPGPPPGGGAVPRAVPGGGWKWLHNCTSAGRVSWAA